MGLNQQTGRRARESAEADFVANPIPYLVGLWKQIGPDAAQKRALPEEPELVAALETEIIPRLVIASRLPETVEHLDAAEPGSTPSVFSTHDRQTFVDALLSEDSSLVCALTDAHLAMGHAPGTILIDLFAWAARELGELWDDDRVSFLDVTIGLCRLHSALHQYSERVEPPAGRDLNSAPKILFVSAPGEQHVFGILMAAELFRQNGWLVTTETSGDPVILARLMASQRFDMAGLSASHDGAVGGLAALAQMLRKASTNPSMKLIVGGQLFEQSPGVALEIGADGIAGRGVDAPELARTILAMP